MCVCTLLVFLFLYIQAMNYKALYPWAPQNLLELVSIYPSRELIVALRKNKCFFGKEKYRAIRLIPCREDELVYCDESSDPGGPFYYFYATVFKRILLHLPLFNFEKELLTEINMASAQIAGHLFGVSAFFARSLAFCHLWKSFCISLRPNT